MKKTVIFAAITTAIGMASAGLVHSDDTSSAAPPQLEKCQVNKDGKSFIKEHMADCKTTSTHSCMGNNSANDTESWIFVPQGECAKINACDLSGLTDNIKNKLDMDALNQACNASQPGAQGTSSTTDGSGASSTTDGSGASSTTDGSGTSSTTDGSGASSTTDGSGASSTTDGSGASSLPKDPKVTKPVQPLNPTEPTGKP